jgi:hypothetical protein
MASSINASTSGAGGVITTADNTGILNIQTAGTTAVTIDASQRAAFVAGTAALPAITTTGDTNTGIFFSAADTIDFAEGGAAVGQFDSSANFKFNSGYGSVATAYGCRAWVNFNGTGTVAIRASGNVSSITDNGAGDYTVNFTTAMPDANFSAVATRTLISSSTGFTTEIASLATGSVKVLSRETSMVDPATFCVSIFR